MQPRKILSVTTRRESTLYDERERMAFELTEAITNISGGVSDELRDAVLTVFSDEARAATYPAWLHHYNHHRPHTGIGGQVPAQRVHNLTGNYN